jgi:hypothetical protein
VSVSRASEIHLAEDLAVEGAPLRSDEVTINLPGKRNLSMEIEHGLSFPEFRIFGIVWGWSLSSVILDVPGSKSSQLWTVFCAYSPFG